MPEVWIDPGIGFGKTHAHNLTLLAHLDAFVATGLPGAGRHEPQGVPRSPARPTPTAPTRPAGLDDRLEGSLATATWAMANGARMVRVHDVRATAHAALVIGGQITKEAA